MIATHAITETLTILSPLFLPQYIHDFCLKYNHSLNLFGSVPGAFIDGKQH